MQAADGPNSSQFEWPQGGVKTMSETNRDRYGLEIRRKTAAAPYVVMWQQ